MDRDLGTKIVALGVVTFILTLAGRLVAGETGMLLTFFLAGLTYVAIVWYWIFRAALRRRRR